MMRLVKGQGESVLLLAFLVKGLPGVLFKQTGALARLCPEDPAPRARL